MGQTNKIILIVEDEIILGMVTKKQLETEGYSVLITTSGEKAVDLVCEKKEPVDLILMDIDLGKGIDGTEAARIILGVFDIPLLFLSSHTEKDIVERTEKITNYGYVVKNSSFTVLDASIKMAFKLFNAHQNIQSQRMDIEAAYEEMQVANEELIDTQHDLLKSEASLRVSEEKYRLIDEASVDLIYSYDRSGHFTHANSRMCRLMGLRAEQIVGKTHGELGFPQKQCEEWEALHRRVYETDSTVIAETETPIPGSPSQYFEVILNPIHDESKAIIGIAGTTRDITERKKTEMLLRENKETLVRQFNEINDLYNNAPCGYHSLSPDGTFLQVNDTELDWLGYAREELVGKKRLYDILTKESLKIFNTVFPVLKEQGSINNVEIEWKRKDGSLLPVLFSGNVIYDQNGNFVRTRSTNTDNSKRKKADQAVRESADRLTRAELASKSGNWELHLDTKTMLASYGAEVIYGIYGDQFTYEEVKSIPLQEYRALLDASLKDLIEKEIPYNIEIKIKTADTGEIKDIHSIATFDRAHKILFGVIQDITDRKKTETTLQEREQYLRLMLETTQDGFWVIKDKKIIDVNNAFCRMSGYSREELLLLSISDLAPYENPADTESRIIRIIEKGTEIFESVHRFKGGGDYDCEISASHNANDSTLICFCRDITRRKKAEKALLESEELYRSLIEGSNDVVFCVDKNGEYRFTNKKFADTFKQKPEYFIGKTFWDIYPKEDADYRQETNRKVFETAESQSIEVVVPLPTSTLYFLAKANPIKNARGEVLLNVTHATDITDRKIAEEKVKTLLAEKELILKESHHRIKNNMLTIGALFNLQLNSRTNPETAHILLDASSRVKSMLVLYDKLYRAENIQHLSLKEYLPDLVKEIMAIFPLKEFVRLETQIGDISLDAKMLSPLGILINELITNSMKYAFQGRNHGLITITAALKENLVTLEYQDDGVGFPESVTFETSTGFGIQLIKSLVEQLHGTIRIERGSGTKFVIQFAG